MKTKFEEFLTYMLEEIYKKIVKLGKEQKYINVKTHEGNVKYFMKKDEPNKLIIGKRLMDKSPQVNPHGEKGVVYKRDVFYLTLSLFFLENEKDSEDYPDKSLNQLAYTVMSFYTRNDDDYDHLIELLEISPINFDRLYENNLLKN